MIIAPNANRLYNELMWALKTQGVEENSRGGRVLTITHPVVFCLLDSRKNILFAPRRRPNPVFHVMEFIWMMAGEDRVDWLLQFNKNMGNFAEDDGRIHGAYGARWKNQLILLVSVLMKDPTTRQAVLAMWEPEQDLTTAPLKDRPCNTHIYFRKANHALNMTVCNRSNDLVWGALGSNIVHFPLLLEWIAHATGIAPGIYRVMTNNLHLYYDLYDGLALMDEALTLPNVRHSGRTHPLLFSDESPWKFILECQNFIQGRRTTLSWFQAVAGPMKDWWETRDEHTLTSIKDTGWQNACRAWAIQGTSKSNG